MEATDGKCIKNLCKFGQGDGETGRMMSPGIEAPLAHLLEPYGRRSVNCHSHEHALSMQLQNELQQLI